MAYRVIFKHTNGKLQADPRLYHRNTPDVGDVIQVGWDDGRPNVAAASVDKVRFCQRVPRFPDGIALVLARALLPEPTGA